MTAGMISQNNIPQFMLPVLKRFDREIWYGECVNVIAEKLLSIIKRAHQEYQEVRT
jgi:hypothetical protein